MEKSSRNTWKARRQRQKFAQVRKLQKQKEKLDKEVAEKQNEEKRREGSSVMLDAFEARLKPNQTIEERLRDYLNSQLETK